MDYEMIEDIIKTAQEPFPVVYDQQSKHLDMMDPVSLINNRIDSIRDQYEKTCEWCFNEIQFWKDRCQELEYDLMSEVFFEPPPTDITFKKRGNFS